MKTRQAILVEKGRFEIQEANVDLDPDSVMVEMQGCGLCTWELNHWAGRLGTPPMPLGHEGWGKVIEVGKKTSGRIKVGNLVSGLGAANFADYFAFPEKHTMLITNPQQKEVPGEPLYCVQNVLRAAHPEIADTVVVIGCGPMGQWVIQGLACSQLRDLVAIDIDDRKLNLAKKYGATHTINSKTTDAVKAVEALTNGRLADVAVEGTGIAAGVQLAIDVLKPRRSKLVVMSSFKGKIEMDIVALCSKAIEVQHAHPGISRDLEDGVRRTEILVNNGVFRMDGIISHRFKLANVMDAFKTLENRPDGYMKGIVTR
jgi:threonine dehydrogenase-like Zn-dependent dehydrogenase